eukprot:m.63583 g.63583  ORF g.63583 m.63583 type:complete len:335 (+) comp13972_c0_seq1:168-1172(+)
MARRPKFKVSFESALPRVEGQTLRPTQADDFSGTVTFDESTVGRSMAEFDVISKLGHGIHGQVNHLRHRASRREAACKKLAVINTASPSMIAVQRELSVLQSQKQNIHLVKFYGYLTEEQKAVYLFMEHMDVGSLSLLRNAPCDIPDPVCLYIAQSMIEGLTYLHRTLHIVHRDIKPSNVLINSLGHVKLCDFSLSKSWSETMATVGTTYVGTFLYMAPERIDPSRQSGRQSNRQPFPGDIWALGLTVAELALQRYPLAESDAIVAEMAEFPIIHMILTSPPPRLRGRNIKLQALVDGCLQRDVKVRSGLDELRPIVQEASEEELLNLLARLSR